MLRLQSLVIIICIELLLPASLLHAQEVSVWDQYHPLEQHKVSYGDEKSYDLIFQDDRGFIWGSQDWNKLFRYDGNEIRFFPMDLEDSTSYSGGRLWTIATEFIQDKTGKIWIKGYRNEKLLERYNPETERFTNFYHRLNEMTEDDLRGIEDIHEDQEGNLWFCSPWLLFKYNLDEDTISSFKLPALGMLVFEDHQGKIWVNVEHDRSLNALYQLDIESGEFINRVDLPLYEQPIFNWTRKDNEVKIDDGESILLQIMGNLFLFNPVEQKATHLPKSFTNNQFTNAVLKMDSLILVGTFGNYVFQFLPHSQSFQLLPGFSEIFNQSSKIPKMLRSQENILWFNTYDGIYKLQPKRSLYENIKLPRKTLSDQYEETDFAYKGEACFHTFSGLVPVRRAGYDFPNIDTNIPGIKDQKAVVRQFEEDKDGNLWMAALWKSTLDIFVFIRQFDKEGEIFKENSFKWKKWGGAYSSTSLSPDSVLFN